jgi:hypothetical protein
MPTRHFEAAEQYLVWALEELVKAGLDKSASQARVALKSLRADQQKADAAGISN